MFHADVKLLPADVQITFDSSMSEEDFCQWLKSRGISDRDCKTLSGKYKVPLIILEYCYHVVVLIPYREWCNSFWVYSV